MSTKTKPRNKSDTKEEVQISQGKVSQVSKNQRTFKLSTTITSDILTSLSTTNNKYDAMDILVDKTPFGRMALNVYTTLTNPSGQYIFINPKTGKRTKKPDIEWEMFTRKRFMNSDAGLDAVFEMLVRSLYTRGDMALELVVSDDASEISSIQVIDPKTFATFKWLEEENRYAIFQKRDDNKEIDLYTGNFLRFPYQPNLSSPFGTLPFESAIMPTINLYQHELDQTTILNKKGYPRFLATIDIEALLKSASPREREDFNTRQELLESVMQQVEEQLASMSRDSDVVTFSPNNISILGGDGMGAGLDLRAWTEADMVALCNAYGLPKIYLNAEKGGSYALGSAEQEVLIKRIDNSRNNIITIKEAIGSFFCRVMGYNAVCKFISNPIEWEKLTEKWNGELKKLEYYRRLQEYGYMLADDIVNILTGEDKAPEQDMKYLTYSKPITTTKENNEEQNLAESEGDKSNEQI